MHPQHPHRRNSFVATSKTAAAWIDPVTELYMLPWISSNYLARLQQFGTAPVTWFKFKIPGLAAYYPQRVPRRFFTPTTTTAPTP